MIPVDVKTDFTAESYRPAKYINRLLVFKGAMKKIIG